MTSTQLPPGSTARNPRGTEAPPPERNRGMVFVWGLMALAGWGAALYFVSNAGQSDEPMRDYFFGLVFAIIASSVAIISVLEDIAGRDR